MKRKILIFFQSFYIITKLVNEWSLKITSRVKDKRFCSAIINPNIYKLFVTNCMPEKLAGFSTAGYFCIKKNLKKS
jgi:hypothetical protein